MTQKKDKTELESVLHIRINTDGQGNQSACVNGEHMSMGALIMCIDKYVKIDKPK